MCENHPTPEPTEVPMDNGKKPKRMADCHPTREHHANGLCRACFERSRISLRPKKTPTCHPERRHYAKGLCHSCYEAQRTNRKPKIPHGPPSCHPDRPHYAFGLCSSCAAKKWLAKKLEDPDYKKRFQEHKKEYARKKAASMSSDEKARRHLRNKYGLTLAQYYEMYENQDGKCALCGTKPKKKKLMVDHNHKTGEVRGLLCPKCNSGMGFFNDDPKLMQMASIYLQKHNRHQSD